MASSAPHLPRKPEFWRIRNINSDERNAAAKWLKEQVEEVDILEGLGYSLAADSEHTLCATVTCFGRPSTPNRTWRMDNTFIGFTPLYDPDDANVDIIAITGLGGHASGSFRCEDGTSVWLRDFGPQNIRQARWITYGYDSAVAASDNNQGVRELADTFSDGLASFRCSTETVKRPLCFVCHSLGGIVLKEALVRSSKLEKADQPDKAQVLEATHGLLFMGVPNLGLQHKQLNTIVKGRANHGFIRDLLVTPTGEPSQFLEYLTKEFEDLDERRLFEIVSYYETRESPTYTKSHNGAIVKDGHTGLMVNKRSAERIGHLLRDTNHLPSNTDHRGLVRFESSQDERYKSAISKLAILTRNATSPEGRRGKEQERRLLCMMHDTYRVGFSREDIPIIDHFVQREADMQRLTSFFPTVSATASASDLCQRVFVVYGMGGVGKTQLCVEFARTYRDRFSAVFRLDGSSKDGLQRAMAKAALRLPDDQMLRVEERANEHEGTMQLSENFRQWLSLPDNTNWLIVIDIVDREWQSNTPDPQAYDYRKFLPFADHGSIIVTTRLKRLRRPRASLELETVNDDLARTILETRAGKQVPDVETLLPRLGGAYLGVISMTTAECIQSYDNTWAELMRYQDRFPLHEYAERSVLTTWTMSYEQVKSMYRQAANLLDLWAYLYPVDIWPELVLVGQDDAGENRVVVDAVFPQISKLSLHDSLGTLSQFSMVTTKMEMASYSIHPVLHAWCLYNVGTSSHMLLPVALRLVAAMVGTAQGKASRDTNLRLATHAKATGNRVKELTENETVHRDCFVIANFLSDWETSAEVECLYLRTLRELEKAWAPDHTCTLCTVNNLGNLYKAQGKMMEAEEMYLRALRGLERACGPEHTSTLDTVNNLGILYLAQGKMEEAETTLTRALLGYRALSHPPQPKINALDETISAIGRRTSPPRSFAA